jgi:hypothetical protein
MQVRRQIVLCAQSHIYVFESAEKVMCCPIQSPPSFFANKFHSNLYFVYSNWLFIAVYTGSVLITVIY